MTYRALDGAIYFFVNFGTPKLFDETLWRLLVVPSFPKLYRTLTKLFWIKRSASSESPSFYSGMLDLMTNASLTEVQ